MTVPLPATERPSAANSRRVAVVCTGCGLDGSVARVALRQASDLAGPLRVSVLSDTLPSRLSPGLDGVRLSPHRFDYLRRLCHVPNAVAFALEARRALIAMHTESPLSLVVWHDLAAAGLVAPGLKRRLPASAVICAHEDIAYRPRGTYGLLHTVLHRWATPRAYRLADAVLALSPHMAARARARGAVAERITLSPAGVQMLELGLEPEQLAPPASTRQGDPLRLLYVGRLAVEKGVGVLLRACQLLGERGTTYALDVIGGGVLGPRLERQARALGLTDRVRFLGPRPRRELGPHYRRADLVCMPSLDDPFGAVAVEALLCGTPVVASNVGGIPFVVRDGQNGLLVPPDAPDRLADAVVGLDRDRARLAALGGAARGSVESRFAPLRAAETLIDGVSGTISAMERRGGAAVRGPGLPDGA